MRRCAYFLFCMLTLHLLTAAAHADYAFITDAELSMSAADIPPLTAQDWRPVELPRSWALDPLHPQDTRQAWYRIPLPPQLLAGHWDHLLMLRHILNVELWLDEHFIGSGGPVSEPVQARLQRNWNRPLLWRVPALTASQEPPRYLYIRLLAEPAYGVMSPIIIGTADSLLPWYRSSYFLQITLVEWSLMALVFTTLLSLFVWNQSRQPAWLLLTAMGLSWALPLLFILLPTLPITEFIALRLIHWGVVAGASALLAFIYRFYFATPSTRLRALLLIPILHGLLLISVPDSRVVAIGNAGQLLCQMLFVALIVQLLRRPERRTREVWAVVIGLVIMLIAALHDVTLFASSNSARWRWDTPLSYVTQPLMLLILAWQGVLVFLQAAQKLAQTNEHLEERLSASEARIRQLYGAQEKVERELRVAAERELVYRDLHDDLGARLLSLVYQSEKGSAQDLARSALQDLRDIVSRVLAQDQGMEAVIADCMSEQMGRAEALGKSFDWEVAAQLESQPADSRLTLGLRLLLRELIGACLHKAAVSHIQLSMGWQDAGLLITLQLTAMPGRQIGDDIATLPVLRKRLRALGAALSQHHDTLRIAIALPSTTPR